MLTTGGLVTAWSCSRTRSRTQAFHFGTRFLVEIDVILPPDMVQRCAALPFSSCLGSPPHSWCVRGYVNGTGVVKSLHEAHDIGESLQNKIESLHEVERAFVHLDFEAGHDPASEHKQWGDPT